MEKRWDPRESQGRAEVGGDSLLCWEQDKELAQRLRALVALAEDPGLVPSTKTIHFYKVSISS